MITIKAKISAIIIFLFFPLAIYANTQKKEIDAVKTNTPLRIDGIIDEEQWFQAPVATNFIQINPYNGKKPAFKTEVRFIYDNDAIYIGAIMHDPQPDSICTEFTSRDQIRIDDYFGVYFDPFNDAQRAFGFFVTAAGVQVDMKANLEGHEDHTWDAVWESAVKINEKGWVAEYKIPYSALRFPKEDIQQWGLNMFRKIQRYRQNNSWNYIDVEESGFINQQGLLTGIEDIKPPMRLSFFPYIAAYAENQSDKSGWDYLYNYGMDLKYGINESFTLDVTLIPDFGQVQSDNQVVNFSPFEVYYQERRPFFTEGTELFNRNGVFYSRRIGSEPDGYQEIIGGYDEENIIDNPTETQLINATKLSGKTNKGLGIGVFNAMTANTYAKVKDSTGKEQQILTQPFTNYNMTIFDQSLKNNSFISVYNTNVYKGKDYTTANLSGIDMRFRDKNNKYQFRGFLNVSQHYHPAEKTDLGFKYYASAGKISGNFLFEYSQVIESDTYNPNDLGFLRNNNEFYHGVELEYNIYDPFWKVLHWYIELHFSYSSLYVPRKYSEFALSGNTRTTFKNYLTVGANIFSRPVCSHDYFEPRVDGWYFSRPSYTNAGVFFSPDYRKKFVVDVNFGMGKGSAYNATDKWINISPRYRINDKLTISHHFHYNKSRNNLGYVSDSTYQDEAIIIFGKRDITNITNTLSTSYIFTNKSSLTFRLRHYWLRAEYNKFYDLKKNGELRPNEYNENHNLNFNAFNIDMVFTWNFAPGSEMLIVWKNAIYTDQDEIFNKFYDNLKHTLESPSTNSFSIKLMYYLDYHILKKVVKKVL